MFDFAKRDLVLWLASLAIAAALMALTANFAFDRFAAGYSEQRGGTKAEQSGSINVRRHLETDGLSASPRAGAAF
jgi:hypothetical protein